MSSLHLQSFGLSPTEPESITSGTTAASDKSKSEAIDSQVTSEAKESSSSSKGTKQSSERSTSWSARDAEEGAIKSKKRLDLSVPSRLTGTNDICLPGSSDQKSTHSSTSRSSKDKTSKKSLKTLSKHKNSDKRPSADSTGTVVRKYKKTDNSSQFYTGQFQSSEDPLVSSPQTDDHYSENLPVSFGADEYSLKRAPSIQSTTSSWSAQQNPSFEQSFSSATTYSSATNQDLSSRRSSASSTSTLKTTQSNPERPQSIAESGNSDKPKGFISSFPSFDSQYNSFKPRGNKRAAPHPPSAVFHPSQFEVSNSKGAESLASVSSSSSFPLKTSSYNTTQSTRPAEKNFESNLSLNPSLLPLSSGSFSSNSQQSVTLDPNLPQSPPLSNPDHQTLNLSPTSSSSASNKLRQERGQTSQPSLIQQTNPSLFTLDKPLIPEPASIAPPPPPLPKTTASNLSRNLSLSSPSPPPAAPFLPSAPPSQTPPQILSPQTVPVSSASSSSISRFNPKTQSFTSSKFLPNISQTPPPFSITAPPEPQNQHQHRRSYSISQPVSRENQDLTQSDPDTQPIQQPLHQPQTSQSSSLQVTSSLPTAELTVKPTGGSTKIFKSYSTRETKSARQKREEEENRFTKSYSTKDYNRVGGSPRLLPPVVIKTRTSSVKSQSRSSFIRSRTQSPPVSVVDKDYISPFSPTFQRRNSHILQAPTEPIEFDSNRARDSTFSPSRSVRSSRSFRSPRSHTVVSRGPPSRSPSRSSSVRFLRQSFKRFTNPLSNQSLISSSPEQSKPQALDTTIKVTDTDTLPINTLDKSAPEGVQAPKPTDSKQEVTDTKEKQPSSSSEASSPSDLQKSRKLRTFQSQDNQDSDQLSGTSSHR